jgi:predicted DNA-binding protein (MmcQ/YjbR family)
MKVRGLEEFCRGLPGATEDIKWEVHTVFSVGKKMFAAFTTGSGVPVGFKCTDIDFEKLVKRAGIIPAPYAARFGWVSVTTEKALGDREARKYLKQSYELVLEGLPRKVREGISGGGVRSVGARKGASKTRRPRPSKG